MCLIYCMAVVVHFEWLLLVHCMVAVVADDVVDVLMQEKSNT